ncbi:MAG TPA: class I SAM-dependent methyltransferase [Dehalococcoidia bacterium]|nr:class I SAM-dependent methyltransferase [Dehalococcoidia bacterium]
MIDAKARAVLDQLERQDALERDQGVSRRERLRQVTPEVGRFLHVLVLAARPRRVLEIGASGGYSTIWLATAARALGAQVTTLEIDSVKVERAAANLRNAGLDDAVTIVPGDAFDYLRARTEPIDLVFLDAEKEDYLAFLALIVPLLPTGGLLVADNLTSHAEELAGFRRAAESDPRLATVLVPIGRGELLAVRIE